MVLGAGGTALNKIDKFFMHMEITFSISVGQRQEVSVKDYISKQFHGQDSLFTMIKSYEKTKQNNMSNMVCV